MVRLVIALTLAVTACAAPPPITAPPPSASALAVVTPVPTVTPSAALTVPAPAAAAPVTRPTTAPASAAAPPPALDVTTAASIAALDAWCATLPPRSVAPLPLDIVGQLANGRSARETVAVLARSTCGLMLAAASYGDGASEVVTVGRYRADGAILWVDRGYWRIASVPVDYGYLQLQWDTQRDGQRELFFAIWSGGSAGSIGFVAVGITGAAAAMTLHTYPGASQMNAARVGEDVLVTGRTASARRWGIDSNCCIPGGHEWLWRWTPAGYALIGERQAQDSYYAVNALLGAIDSGHPETASDVATRSTIDAAAAFFGPGRLWTYKASSNAFEQERAELMRWSVLPGAAPIPAAVVRYQVARYEPAGPSAVITFERVGGSWMATDIEAGTLP